MWRDAGAAGDPDGSGYHSSANIFEQVTAVTAAKLLRELRTLLRHKIWFSQRPETLLLARNKMMSEICFMIICRSGRRPDGKTYKIERRGVTAMRKMR